MASHATPSFRCSNPQKPKAHQNGPELVGKLGKWYNNYLGELRKDIKDLYIYIYIYIYVQYVFSWMAFDGFMMVYENILSGWWFEPL